MCIYIYTHAHTCVCNGFKTLDDMHGRVPLPIRVRHFRCLRFGSELDGGIKSGLTVRTSVPGMHSNSYWNLFMAKHRSSASSRGHPTVYDGKYSTSSTSFGDAKWCEQNCRTEAPRPGPLIITTIIIMMIITIIIIISIIIISIIIIIMTMAVLFLL